MMAARVPHEDHKFWLYYARHMLALADEAARQTVPLRAILKGTPRRAAIYGARAIKEMKDCMDGAPSRRRRDLGTKAVQFKKRKGWRGDISILAESFASALDALASEQRRQKAGRRSGVSKYAERLYVEKIISEEAARFPTIAAFLLSRGPGRSALERRVIERATEQGVSLDIKVLKAQIRERAKAGVHYNYLAGLG